MALQNTETLTAAQAKAVYTAFKAVEGIGGSIDDMQIGKGLRVCRYSCSEAIGIVINGVAAAEHENLAAFRKAYKLRK